MSILRLQCSWQYDTAFPRDKFVITPHFETTGLLEDADALCEDLATALKTYTGSISHLQVKAYDAQGEAPNYPIGEANRDVGGMQTSGMPREIAICLSFYSERNIPRRRGRLYLPGQLVQANMAARPSATNRDKVMALGPILASLGGVDVDWVVYSRADDEAYKVSNYWCDDEWDVQRSRGLRGSARTTATTGG